MYVHIYICTHIFCLDACTAPLWKRTSPNGPVPRATWWPLGYLDRMFAGAGTWRLFGHVLFLFSVRGLCCSPQRGTTARNDNPCQACQEHTPTTNENPWAGARSYGRSLIVDIVGVVPVVAQVVSFLPSSLSLRAPDWKRVFTCMCICDNVQAHTDMHTLSRWN